MIRKIKRIRNFGVFKDYTWPIDLQPFQELNLIYGWNYSGKTTLSRIFRSFEQKKAHPDYLIGTFELEDTDGRSLTEQNLESLPNVRVFNSDFVKENLRWQDGTQSIQPVFVLGRATIELQDMLTTREKHAAEIYDRLNSEKASLKDNSETSGPNTHTCSPLRIRSLATRPMTIMFYT